jgi:hypothetical protein
MDASHALGRGEVDPEERRDGSLSSRSWAGRWLWALIWMGHAAAAASWWWLMPHDFPPSHPRFWVNTVLPWLLLGLSLTGLFAVLRCRLALLGVLAVSPVVLWLAAGVTAIVLFPDSGEEPLLGGLCGGLPLALLFVLAWRRLRFPLVPAVGVGAATALLTVLAVWTQQAGPPATRPLNPTFPDFPAARTDPPSLLTLGAGVRVWPKEGVVERNFDRVKVTVSPLLTFVSRSPDKFWTVFAPDRERVGLPRTLAGWQIEGDPPESVSLGFEDDARRVLRVRAERDAGAVEIEAYSRLEQPVYSHLNSWCAFTIEGHRELSLEFSPCPDVPIPVLPFDYPFGRPARLAYVDAAGMFRVVEAHDAEKGPFRELASGTLTEGAPLVITLYDAGRRVCRIVFDDWTAQAGRALSPTAGWGLPVNAIEFHRRFIAPGSACQVWLSLASTSVGRGWDSVGHAPGVYRNRMRIVPLEVRNRAVPSGARLNMLDRGFAGRPLLPRTAIR